MIRFACRAALLLSLAAATPALAQDWRVAAIAGEKPDRSVYLIDAQSIVRSGDAVTFTTQSIFEQLAGTRDFDRSVTKRRGNCTAMSSQITENNYYAKGAFMSTDSVPGNNNTHKEGTIMYGVLMQACGTKALEPGTVSNPEAAVRAFYAK